MLVHSNSNIQEAPPKNQGVICEKIIHINTPTVKVKSVAVYFLALLYLCTKYTSSVCLVCECVRLLHVSDWRCWPVVAIPAQIQNGKNG